MTGSGTQDNPYIVDTWEDFAVAISKENAYVALSGDIDATNARISSTIKCYCTRVDGYNHSIYNLNVHNVSPVIEFFKRTNFYDLNFLNVYLDSSTLFYGNVYVYDMGRFNRCNFTCDLVGNSRFAHQYYTVMMGGYSMYFVTCGIHLIVNGGSMALDCERSLIELRNTHLRIEGKTSSSTAFCRVALYKSYIDGDIELTKPSTSSGVSSAFVFESAPKSDENHFSNSIINLKLTNKPSIWIGRDYNYSTNGIAIITDGLDESWINLQTTSSAILCSEAQASDSEFMQKNGFAWSLVDGELTGDLIRKAPDLGAFANADNLHLITIPKSVKKIGRYAFRNTGLKSVVIAPDCVWYDTSFPEDCQVKYYS